MPPLNTLFLTTRVGGLANPSVALVHGLSGSSRWWARNIPELATRYRLLVPDLIGFGRSRTPSRVPDIDRLALLLVEWMDARGLGRTHAQPVQRRALRVVIHERARYAMANGAGLTRRAAAAKLRWAVRPVAVRRAWWMAVRPDSSCRPPISRSNWTAASRARPVT